MAVINWYTTHNKAICHKLFSTAHPIACRKLDWLSTVMSYCFFRSLSIAWIFSISSGLALCSPSAMAMIDLIRADELSRLSLCEADGGEGVVVDLSRNRSRRFCSTACGNRTAVAAYRARKAAGA